MITSSVVRSGLIAVDEAMQRYGSVCGSHWRMGPDFRGRLLLEGTRISQLVLSEPAEVDEPGPRYEYGGMFCNLPIEECYNVPSYEAWLVRSHQIAGESGIGAFFDGQKITAIQTLGFDMIPESSPDYGTGLYSTLVSRPAYYFVNGWHVLAVASLMKPPQFIGTLIAVDLAGLALPTWTQRFVARLKEFPR